MKRFLLLTIAVFCLLLKVDAQDNQVKFGLKGGLSVSTVSARETETYIADAPVYQSTYQSRLSFFVTATVEVPLDRSWSLIPGLSVNGKGAKEKINAPNDYTVPHNFVMLEIPVNVVKSFKIGDGALFIGAGPYVGAILSGNENLVGNSTKSTYYKRLDWGAGFVAGYTFTKHININAGYELGLSNNLNATNSTGDYFKNRVLTIGLGYTF